MIAAQKGKPRDPKEPSPWEEFLVPTETGASNPVALKLTAKEIPHFREIPALAPARSHAQDKALYAVQEKIRMAMLCFVNTKEEENNADRYVGAAFLRSAHEELLQMRRRGAAGHKAHALDPRPDGPRESLFTPDGEKKMRGRG